MRGRGTKLEGREMGKMDILRGEGPCKEDKMLR